MKYISQLDTPKNKNPLYKYQCEICGLYEDFEGARMDNVDGERKVLDKYSLKLQWARSIKND